MLEVFLLMQTNNLDYESLSHFIQIGPLIYFSTTKTNRVVLGSLWVRSRPYICFSHLPFNLDNFSFLDVHKQRLLKFRKRSDG